MHSVYETYKEAADLGQKKSLVSGCLEQAVFLWNTIFNTLILETRKDMYVSDLGIWKH